jgi:hypothetical protein
MEWNEHFFRDCFDNVVRFSPGFPSTEVIRSTPDGCKQSITDKKIICGTVMIKSVETTFDTTFNDGKGHVSEKVVQVSCQG